MLAWRKAQSEIIDWIGSQKIELIGRRYGNYEPLQIGTGDGADIPANVRVVDWFSDTEEPIRPSPGQHDPPHNPSFLLCCYFPDDENFTRDHQAARWSAWRNRNGLNDRYFRAAYESPHLTHLQVNIAQLAAALRTAESKKKKVSRRPPLWDWDAMTPYVESLFAQRGDFADPAERTAGWTCENDLIVLIQDYASQRDSLYLGKDDKGSDGGPSRSSVQRFLNQILPPLRRPRI